MDDSLRTAFQHTRLVTDEQTYCMVHLPRQAIVAAAAVIASEAEPFSALIADKDEVTLILAEDAFAEYAARLPALTPACLRDSGYVYEACHSLL